MDEQPSRRDARLLPSLAAEFRRRGVWRAASLYLVGAWIAIQAAGELSAAFALSRRLAAVVIILAIAGFPAVVLGAWFFRLGVGIETEQVPAGLNVSRRQLHLGLASALLAGLLVLTLTAWFALARRPRETPGATLPAIAILPFTDAGTAGPQAFLAPSLAPALTEHFKSAGLHVVADPVAERYAAAGVRWDSIARALDIDFVVTGHVMSNGVLARVMVRLVDPLSGQVVDTVRVERGSNDALALVDAVVNDVGERLQRKVGRLLRLQRWRAGTDDPGAYELLLRANQVQELLPALDSAGDAPGAFVIMARADSLLAAAIRKDRRYVDALLERALITRNLATRRYASGQRSAIDSLLYTGELHASRALDIDPDNGRAFQVRGGIRHLRAAFLRTSDPQTSLRLDEHAVLDLERAVDIDPGLVHGLKDLASIYGARGEFGRALQTLDRAYHADVFQEGVPQLLTSLFEYSFELARDSAAEQYCAALQRRPDGSPTVKAYCELQLAAWSLARHERPSIARAWAAALAARTAAIEQTRGAPLLSVLVAGVIARAGLPDSARAVLHRARAAGPDDPELLQLEAGVRVLLRDYDEATRLLRAYASHSGNALTAGSRRFALLPANPLVQRPTD